MNSYLLKLTVILTFIATGQNTNTLLWKFYKKGQKPSYIYGTFHSKAISHDDYHDSLDVKIKRVDRVYVELDDKETAKISGLMMSKMMLPKGKTLKDFLSEKEYSRYAEFAEKKMGEKYYIIDFMHPLMVSIMLTMFDEIKLEMDSSKLTVDNYIEKYAKDHSVQVTSLESAEEQANALSGISIKESAKSLMETVDQYDKSITLKDSLRNLYRNQNLNAMVELMNDPDMRDGIKMIQGPLLDKRNKIMIKRVNEYITETGKTTLVAVGAFHLVGNTGLIEGFRRNGYIVEPVR